MIEEHCLEIDLSKEERNRYSRHISLFQIGEIGQKKIKASSVVCIGAGGLGSPALTYLAAAGVGHIGIVDFDKVDISNLQRQVIHGESWIGKSKVDSAKSRIKEINSNIKVTLFKNIINKNNILEIIKSFDIVCDCTDNFPSRYLINDACLIHNKPYIYGSIESFTGQVTVFNLKEDSPNLRSILPEPPPPNSLPTCSQAGVMGVLPGIIGSIQATEVIKIIAGIGAPLDGRLLVFNALDMHFKEFKIPMNKEKINIDKLIEYEGYCFDENIIREIEFIESSNLNKLISANNNKFIIIDVRSYEERSKNHISNSYCYPLPDIENGFIINELKSICKGKTAIIYCQSGKRSCKAIIELKKYGIKAINLKGGIDQWECEKER